MTTTTTTSNLAWSTALSHHDLIPLGSDTIEISISGPARTSPTAPLVIIEHGHGASLYEWVVAARHISSFARCLTYSRAGYGRSISGPPSSQSPRTTTNISHDLHALLEKLELAPPYLLVGHSYGGNIVRTFLSLYPQDVAGMVLVDSYCVYEPPPRDELFGALMGPGGMQTYGEVLGLTTNHVFAPDEWTRLQEMGKTPSTGAAAGREEEHFAACVNGVNEMQGLTRVDDGSWRFDKQQLGAGRLSVLSGSVKNDITRLFENAKENGYVTDDVQKECLEWLEHWGRNELGAKACALSLSSDSRLVEAEGLASTHNVHFLRPDMVAKEVKWVLKLDD